jgi:hypothetical protein
MAFEEYDVRLTDHAYEQYCKRVGPDGREEIRDKVMDLLYKRDYHRKAEYLLVDGVWWVFALREQQMFLITCYGRTHIYVPAAKKWAHFHNDRIDLTGIAALD